METDSSFKYELHLVTEDKGILSWGKSNEMLTLIESSSIFTRHNGKIFAKECFEVEYRKQLKFFKIYSDYQIPLLQCRSWPVTNLVEDNAGFHALFHKNQYFLPQEHSWRISQWSQSTVTFQLKIPSAAIAFDMFNCTYEWRVKWDTFLNLVTCTWIFNHFTILVRCTPSKTLQDIIWFGYF